MSGWMQRLGHRLQALVGIGRVTLVDDTTSTVQRAQLTLGQMETRDNTPRLAEYGFASNPPPGTDAVMLFVGGDRSNGVVIATGNQTYRLKGLASGDAALYDSRGQSVWLTPGGLVVNGAGLPMVINNTPSVTVNASSSVTLNTPTTHCTGNLTVDGNVVAQGDISDHGSKSMAGMRTVYNGHTHSDPQGGSVSTPNQGM